MKSSARGASSPADDRRPQRGHPFRTEQDLQRELFKHDLRLSGAFKHTAVRRELPVGGCVPDLVYVRFADRPSEDVWPDRWSFLHAVIVWLLRQRHRLKPATILNLAYDSPSRTEAALYDLLDSGAIQESRSGSYGLADELAEMRAEVVAVEAKLRDWRQALWQAVSYRRFADRVSVVLGSKAAPREREAIQLFRRWNVGLGGLRGNKLNWIVTPTASAPVTGPDREYIITSAAVPSPYTLWSLR